MGATDGVNNDKKPETITWPGIRVQQGDSYEKIVIDFNNQHPHSTVTVDETVKRSKIKPENLKPGDVITLSSPEMERARRMIDIAVDYGYGDLYDFTLDDRGYIIVTLEKDRDIADIKRDFKLPDGSLSETNDFGSNPDRYHMKRVYSNKECDYVLDADNGKVDKGDKLVIKGSDFDPNQYRNPIARFFFDWDNIPL